MAGVSPCRSGCKAEAILDTTPFHWGALTRTPTLSPGQLRQAHSPHVYVLGMWEETEAPRENPRGREENLNTPHTVSAGWDSNFFFNVITKQC